MREDLNVAAPKVATEQSDILGRICADQKDVVFMMAASNHPTKRPDLNEFVQIAPRNLSAKTISFYCISAPPSESIVLLLGKLEGDPIYVSAVVTSCTEGFWERKRRYLVGCDLTRRI